MPPNAQQRRKIKALFLTHHIGSLFIVCAVCFPLIGCGGGSEATVIQPTESYQPTDQEKQNSAKAAASKEFGN